VGVGSRGTIRAGPVKRSRSAGARTPSEVVTWPTVRDTTRLRLCPLELVGSEQDHAAGHPVVDAGMVVMEQTSLRFSTQSKKSTAPCAEGRRWPTRRRYRPGSSQPHLSHLGHPRRNARRFQPGLPPTLRLAPDPVPCHWRRGGPFMLAGNNHHQHPTPCHLGTGQIAHRELSAPHGAQLVARQPAREVTGPTTTGSLRAGAADRRSWRAAHRRWASHPGAGLAHTFAPGARRPGSCRSRRCDGSTRAGGAMCRQLDELCESVVDYARRFDVGVLTPAQAGTVVERCARMEGSIAAMRALAAARSAEGESWKKEGCRSPAVEQLGRKTGTSPTATRRALETGRRLREQPEVADAALGGALSAAMLRPSATA